MKPSFQKFLNFLKSTKLNPEKTNELHKLLFMSPMSHKLDIEKLKRKLDIPNVYAEKIYRLLIENAVLDVEHFHCPQCGEDISKIIDVCSSCGKEIDGSNYYVNIDGLLDEYNKNLIRSKYFESNKAEIIAEEWDKQKYLSYVLIDLVDSEKVQEVLGDQDYTLFFEEIREILKYYALSATKGEYLILGEIGDCIKIAFTKKEDVLTFFNKFSKELSSRINNSEVIKKYILQLDYFPKFSGIVDVLPLPSTSFGDISAKSIVVITLNGAIDFNSKALTGLFRLDSGAKINKDFAFRDNNVSLWMGKNFIKDTEYKEFSIVDIKVGKHKTVTRKTALVLFADGVEKEIKNPEKYVEVKTNETAN